MLLLATYRALLTLHWIGWLSVCPLVLAVDNLVRSRIKALEFGTHAPEAFGLLLGAVILVTCATVIGLLLPVSLPPALLPAAPLLVASLRVCAIASFHAHL